MPSILRNCRRFLIIAALPVLALLPLAGGSGAQSGNPAAAGPSASTPGDSTDLVARTRATLSLLRGAKGNIRINEGTVADLIQQVRGICPVPLVVHSDVEFDQTVTSFEFTPTHGSLADCFDLMRDMGYFHWEARGETVRILDHSDQLTSSRVGLAYNLGDLIGKLVERDIAARKKAAELAGDAPEDLPEPAMAAALTKIESVLWSMNDGRGGRDYRDESLNLGADGIIWFSAPPMVHVLAQEAIAQLRGSLAD